MVKAIVANGTGGPEVLSFTELEPAELGSGQVRVEVELVGVNFWDVMQRRGVVPIGPRSVPGVEGVGRIIEVGSDVAADRVGERVAWSKVGASYATEVVGDAWAFVPVPEGIESEDAAGLLMQGVTAQYLAESAWPVASGDFAVVMAAAGGVGTLLTQFLVARGVTVIGVVSREEKRQASLDAGAAHVVIQGDDLVEQVRAIAPDGVGAVYDANGGEASLQGIDMLQIRGCLVLYGTAGGPIPQLDLNRLGAGSFFVSRAGGGHYARTPEEWRERADDVLARAAAGTLKAQKGGIWKLDQAVEAQKHLESRESTGKLLLQVR